MTAHPEVDGAPPGHPGETPRTSPGGTNPGATNSGVPTPGAANPAIATADSAGRADNPAPSRRSWAPKSIGSRLVAGVVSLVVVLVLATGGCTYIALRSFLYQRLNQQVDSAATSAATSPCFQRPVAQAACVFSNTIRTGQHVWFNELDTTGASLVNIISSGQSSDPELTFLPLSKPASTRFVSEPVLHVTMNYQGTTLKVSSAPITVNDQVVAFIVVGFSVDDVQNTLHQLVAKELIIGAIAILVAMFATAYGVTLSLRRLKRVTATAQEVAAELSPEGAGLDRRVPTDGDSTEVGQLAESMNTLLAAVETQFAARVESEERMRQFLADASHELRTPLTSIRGYAELARMQRAAGETDEDNIGRIESEGTRMSRLVEDLLILARGDQDAIPRIELVDVAEIVDDAVTGVRAANPQRAIDVEPIGSYNVVGDPDQLVRVIRNLLSNAVVHTPQTSPIRVRAFVDGPGIAIQVIDGGPGLPPEEAEHVFERFWRADKARTRARGGSGLGLSIVAAIVHAHQGAAHFESSVAGGSTVTVWLPGVTA